MTTPMLASPATDIPQGAEWIAEPKFDGWRAIARKGGDGVVNLFTRSGKPIDTAPYIADALMNIPPRTIVDGEIVNLAGGGEWNRTQELLSRKEPHTPSATDPPLTYVIFDVLECDGDNLMGEPLSTRRQILKLLGKLADPELVRVVEDVACVGSAAEELYARLTGEGFEGIVCKNLTRSYQQGARNGAWVKIKPVLEMDVEVTGAYDAEPGSKYTGTHAGGITFLATHNDGKTYNGRAAGMDDPLRKALYDEPEGFKGKVAVVAYQSVGTDGALRFPRFIRFRDPADKSASDLAEPTTTAQDSSQPKGFLLERLVELEAENDELRVENADLRTRLKAALALDEAEAAGATRKRRAPRRSPSLATPEQAAVAKPSRAGTSPRNFAAMGNDKLRSAVVDLRRGAGDAYQRTIDAGLNPVLELARAEAAARRKGVQI